MSADSHCLTTECMVCLINTHKQSTNGMEIATAFRAAHSQGCGERKRENTSAALRTAQNPAAALPLFFLPQTDGCNQRDSPRLQSSISQPGKWYVHHLCYVSGTSAHITCVRPDKGMIGEMERHQIPAIPEGWEDGQVSPSGPAVAVPQFSGTHCLMYITAKQTIPLINTEVWTLTVNGSSQDCSGSYADVLGRHM